jgi:hypothetical protein
VARLLPTVAVRGCSCRWIAKNSGRHATPNSRVTARSAVVLQADPCECEHAPFHAVSTNHGFVIVRNMMPARTRLLSAGKP